MFRVGQKVVCVNDSNFVGWRTKRGLGCKFPVRDAVYTIRGFSHIGGLGLFLVEIVNKPIMTSDAGFAEITFCASRFRPAVDISDLESIVTEVFKGKPRKIKGDRFDRQRITSAASASPSLMQHDARVSPTPAPVSRNGECGTSCPTAVGGL